VVGIFTEQAAPEGLSIETSRSWGTFPTRNKEKGFEKIYSKEPVDGIKVRDPRGMEIFLVDDKALPHYLYSFNECLSRVCCPKID
jgi:hypothetical protein